MRENIKMCVCYYFSAKSSQPGQSRLSNGLHTHCAPLPGILWLHRCIARFPCIQLKLAVSFFFGRFGLYFSWSSCNANIQFSVLV